MRTFATAHELTPAIDSKLHAPVASAEVCEALRSGHEENRVYDPILEKRATPHGGRALPRFRRLLPLLVASILCVTTGHAAVDPARLEAAQALYRDRSKAAEAQLAYATIAAEDPNNAAAHYFMGLLAYRRDEVEQAVVALETATRLAPNNGDYQKALGDAYGRSAQKASVFRQLGLAKKCLACYQRAVALEPNRAEFHSSLFDYYRQAPGFAGGGFELAAAEAATIKQLDPARGRLAFASLYAGAKKWDQAFAQFEEVLKDDPDNWLALYHVGRLSSVTGQFTDRGLAALRRCLELPPPTASDTPSKAALHWRFGTLLEKKSDVAGARAAYEAALKIDATFAPAAEALKKLH